MILQSQTSTVCFAGHMVEAELDGIVQEDMLEPNDYAALMVAVLKADGRSVRVCGDIRMTVNPS